MDTKNFVKREWILWVFLILPFIIIGVFWDKFPDQVPMHWNFEGKADSYAAKGWGLFFGPLLNVGLYLLLLIIPRIDPRKANFEKFGKVYKILRVFFVIFFFFINTLTSAASIGIAVDVGNAIMYAMLILFIFMGNYLGNIKPNYFIGIRTPWTLENPEVWKETHRFASKLWVYVSIPMLILTIFVHADAIKIINLIFIGVIALVPVIYSYIAYKKIKRMD